MGNRWHATQDKNMRPDVAFNSCPWCGSDSICVDTTKFEHEHLNTWTAQACCHECGAKSPDSDFDAEYGSDLYNQKQDLDIEVERGDDNLVFHDGYDDREHCEARLKNFIDGDIEVSHRNRVLLDIVGVMGVDIGAGGDYGCSGSTAQS